MSGGHFDHNQRYMLDIAEEIDGLIKYNKSPDAEECGGSCGMHYGPETITKFKIAALNLRLAYSMVHAIDMLVSGDESEESFHKRWRNSATEALKEMEQL